MRRIIKGQEPQSWREFRETPGVSYEAKPELREALIREQGYICAYCMQRISLDRETHIEHMKSRKEYPGLQLVYQNMVLCCTGNTKGNVHCDNRKGKRSITFDLFSDTFFDTLSYSINANTVTIKSSNPVWDKEINDILNLNCNILKINRQQVLNAVITTLGEKKDWNKNLRRLQQLRDRWDTKDAAGRYNEFCGVVVWFLNRRIAYGQTK